MRSLAYKLVRRLLWQSPQCSRSVHVQLARSLLSPNPYVQHAALNQLDELVPFATVQNAPVLMALFSLATQSDMRAASEIRRIAMGSLALHRSAASVAPEVGAGR